jgi:hypothetical protein
MISAAVTITIARYPAVKGAPKAARRGCPTAKSTTSTGRVAARISREAEARAAAACAGPETLPSHAVDAGRGFSQQRTHQVEIESAEDGVDEVAGGVRRSAAERCPQPLETCAIRDLFAAIGASDADE